MLFNEDWEYLDRCRKTLAQLDECVDWETLHTIRETRAKESKPRRARWPTDRLVAAVAPAFAGAVRKARR